MRSSEISVVLPSEFMGKVVPCAPVKAACLILFLLVLAFGQINSTQAVQSDLSGDGYVDVADIGVFSENWLDNCGSADCNGADLNGSGRVDFADYAGLSRYWLQWASDLDIVGWWKFDESSGLTAADSSGNSHPGTLYGSMTTSDWVAGKRGKALDFDGSNDYVSIMKSANGLGQYFTKDFTIAAWIKPSSITDRRAIVGIESTAEFTTFAFEGFCLELVSGKPTVYISYGDTNRDIVSANTTLTTGQWYHICVTRSGPAVTFYINGLIDAVVAVNDSNIRFKSYSDTNGNGYDSIGATSDSYYNQTNWFRGIIDDVRIYNRVLSYGTIMHLGQAELAFNPDPSDGAPNISSTTLLKWWPGRLAQSVNGHDIYLGANFSDVTTATSSNPLGVYKGRQSASSFDPGALADSTTYYWRIDEVNGVQVSKGTIWSFTTAAHTYTATASSSALGFDAGGAYNSDRFLADPGQAWEGDSEQTSWWWQMSFANPTQVGSILQIVGDQEDYLSNAPASYIWQWSSDNSTWHDISETAITNERRMYRIHRFASPISAKYWRMSIASCTWTYPTVREVEFYPLTTSVIDFPDWIVPVNIMPDQAYLPMWDVTRFIPLARACTGWAGVKAQETLMQDFDESFLAAEPHPLCVFLSGSYLDWCQVPGDAFSGIKEVLYNRHIPMWGSCGGCQLMGILLENGIPEPSVCYTTPGMMETWDCPHCRNPLNPKSPIYTHLGHSKPYPIACGDYTWCTGEHGTYHILKMGSDAVFNTIPSVFLAEESHIGQIAYVPTGWELVATYASGAGDPDPRAYMQCMRLTGSLIYAAQFHIEMYGDATWPESWPYSQAIMTNFLNLAKQSGGYNP